MSYLKVNRITFQRMRHGLHREYHKSVVYLIDKMPSEVLAVIPLDAVLPAYRAAVDVEKGTPTVVMQSKYTFPLAETDRDRDQAHSGFVTSVKAMLRHFDQDIRDAAGRVLYVLKHYGRVSRKNYEQETASIRDLLRELDNDDLTKDLHTLRVMEWRDHLEEVNHKFEHLLQQRYDEKAATPVNRIKEVRKDTDRCFRILIEYLEALQKVGKSSPELISFITMLNALTQSFQHTLTRRKSKPKKAEALSKPKK